MKSYALAALCALSAASASAGVNKIYYPHVEYGEAEIELRGVHQHKDGHHLDDNLRLDLAYGMTTWWMTELVFELEKEDGESAELEAYEWENLFQLSEQGEYFADFGLLVELEKPREEDAYEVKFGPLIQKDWGSIVGTANILFEREFSNEDEGAEEEESEWETLVNLQLKYRRHGIEPAIEYYAEEETAAVGPVLLSEHKFANTKIKWQLGWLFGMNNDTPDNTVRWMLEFEF